jgi:Putative addiction module component
MTVEAFVEGLSRSDKLFVMELIWRDLTVDSSAFESPAWHDRVANERLTNPMPDAPLGLKEAFEEIRGWRNDRKITS